MSDGRVERRLAAILAADIAGYSRLMGQDEEGTLAALKAIRRELGDPKISEYRGRLVKTTGDGLLVEFPSVVDAVCCAVDVQRAMVERGGPIRFRIGINLGDMPRAGRRDQVLRTLPNGLDSRRRAAVGRLNMTGDQGVNTLVEMRAAETAAMRRASRVRSRSRSRQEQARCTERK